MDDDGLDEHDARRMRAAQIATIIRLVPLTAGINIFNATIVVGTFWGTGNNAFLAGWEATLALVMAVSVVSWARTRKTPPCGASVRTTRRMVDHSIVLAAVWGVAPLVLLPGADDSRQLLMAYVCTGMTAGGAFCLSTLPRAGLAYTWTLSAGSIAALFLAGHGDFAFSALLLAIYAVFLSRNLVAHGRLFAENHLNEMNLSRKGEVIGLLLHDFEEHASDWLWETDADGALVRVSERFAVVAEQSSERLQGMKFRDLFDTPRTEPSAVAELIGLVARRVAFRDLVVPVRIGGALHYWSLTAKQVFDRRGDFAGYRGIGRDITDKWLTDEKLKTQAQNFEAALDNMPHGLSMFDKDFRLVVCNKRYATMYGHTPEETAPGSHILTLARSREARGCTWEGEVAYIEQAVSGKIHAQSGSVMRTLADGRVISIAKEELPNGGLVNIHEDISALKRAERQMHHLASHDALTGLSNRAGLREHLQQQLAEGAHDAKIALLCLDLDLFKTINDTLGHPVGDALLVAVAGRLREVAGAEAVIARQGGDEFTILQTGVEQPTAATDLAQRLVDAVSQPFEIEGHDIVIGVSVGISVAPNDGTDPDHLLKCADLALYRAKEGGRAAFCFFEAGMDADMHERRVLEMDLRKAISGGEFEVYYQPSVDLARGEISGFEALVRWNHPTRGLVSPAAFIPLAEETGLIAQLGEWVLRQACAEAAKWPDHISIAVNLSAVQFRSKNLVATVMSAVATAGIAAKRLELEITESVMLADTEANLAILHQLRGFGVRIAMDDFGTGYSSLSYLRSFPFDKIKIDRSFVKDLDQGKDAIAIIRAISGLSSDLGMVTTVEGVETMEQLALVRGEGCNEVQGYLYSRPQPASEVFRMLASVGETARAVA